MCGEIASTFERSRALLKESVTEISVFDFKFPRPSRTCYTHTINRLF
jgi:hypothetical protein